MAKKYKTTESKWIYPDEEVPEVVKPNQLDNHTSWELRGMTSVVHFSGTLVKFVWVWVCSGAEV